MSEEYDVEAQELEETTTISLVAVLENVIELVQEARTVPFSSNVMINKAQVLELLNSAIDVLPEDIVTADRVVAEAENVIDEANKQSEEIIEQAQAEAEAIIANAHEHAKSLVASERVIMLANESAEKVINVAEANARKLTQGADIYCNERLTELEGLLEAISRQITAGREAIAARSVYEPEVESVNATEIAEENYPYDNQ